MIHYINGERSVMANNRCLMGLILVLGMGCDQPSPDVPVEDSAVNAVEAVKPVFEAKPAEVGVGLQGQSLQNETGVGKIIAGPAVTLFQTKQKVVFEIQVPQALELHRGLEGDYPKSHAEFMEKIIKANNINLPKLPEGQVYRYHPDDHTLWVEPKPES